MTKLDLETAFGADNVAYMDEKSKAALSQLPASAAPALQVAVAAMTGDKNAIPGLECGVATTTETLADLDKARARAWSEQGFRHEFGAKGHTAIMYARFRLHSEDSLKTQVVIDFGDIRAVLYFSLLWSL